MVYFSDSQRQEPTFPLFQNEISSLIGDDDWSKLQASVNVSMLQEGVHNGIALDLKEAGLPLNAVQEEALARAMADAELASPLAGSRPATYYAVDPATGLKPADQAMLAKAAENLSPYQLQLLKNDLVMQNRSYDDAGSGSVYVDSVTGASIHIVEMPKPTADDSAH